MSLYNNVDSFNASKCAAHCGYSSEAPSVYNQTYFLKGYKSVEKSYKITDFKSIAFVGSFSECCEYIKNKTYFKGYVIASYNL